jgi:TonB family protein
MSHKILSCCAAIAIATAGAFAQSAPEVDAGKTASAQSSGAETAVYPETPEGLKKLLQDVFAAEKAGDTTKSEKLYASMGIPDHAAWFAKTFGEAEGARLEAKYASSGEEFSARPKKMLQIATREDQTNVSVLTYPTPNEPPLVEAFLAAMTSPTTLYHATARRAAEGASVILIGNFVFVSGGFRYVDFGLMMALSNAPPTRVRPGGDVAKPKLVYRVDPIYPAEASRQGIQGTVRLHVVLAKDGSVRQMNVVSGDPLLAQAAMDAVKQWRYQPTLLNGEPVEVVTEVEVFFGRRK